MESLGAVYSRASSIIFGDWNACGKVAPDPRTARGPAACRAGSRAAPSGALAPEPDRLWVTRVCPTGYGSRAVELPVVPGKRERGRGGRGHVHGGEPADRPGPPPPLVLSGHAASLTPY